MLLALTMVRTGRESPPNHYATASGTPGPPQHDRTASRSPDSVSGDAPWALSALPECFRQLSSASGSYAFARSKLPSGARPLGNGESLTVADCRVTVRGDEIEVVRGTERLRVPPEARLLLAGPARIVLDRRDGKREDVRVYERAGAP